MTRSRRIRIPSAIFAAIFLATTAGGVALADDTASSQAQPAPKKHSKLKGAVVGGAGGAVVGGKKGAAVGAAGGALVQHHKNKKEAKRQAKEQEKK